MSLYQRVHDSYFGRYVAVDTARVSEAMEALLTPENIAKAEEFILKSAKDGFTHVLHINTTDDMHWAFVPTNELRNAWLESYANGRRNQANHVVLKALEKVLPGFLVQNVDHLPDRAYFMASWDDGVLI